MIQTEASFIFAIQETKLRHLLVMICHQYSCIFIHIPKCAGQSVERIFLDAVGLNWTTRAPLLLRINDRPELGPPHLAHLTARDYVACKYVTPQQFESYFKFAIVRNPWDRMISFYKYLGFYKCSDFKSFLNGYFVRRLWTNKYWFVRPQYEFLYNEKGECMVDYIGRFEHLQKNMQYVGKRVGLKINQLPLTNKSRKELPSPSVQIGELYRYVMRQYINRRRAMLNDYRAYYDKESISRVAQMYKRDIELFGYEFDPPGPVSATPSEF